MIESRWKYRRLFEILPGVISWLIILSPIILSLLAPDILAIYMIFFLTYWLVKTFFMSARLIVGYKRFRHDMRVNWRQKLEGLPPDKAWGKIYHLVIVPTYKEDIQILRSSIESVIKSDYPAEKIIYLLATEERDRERAEQYGRIICQDYRGQLGEIITKMHPGDIPNEVAGKGPNITYAIKEVLPYFEKRGISPKNIIVTNMDADNRLDKNYLACLTYKYLSDPDPVHKSFQPLPMFFNNIWDVPMAMRQIAMGSSFWQMIVNTRPSRLRNFSAHAQSLEALIEVDFWSKTTIVEDGHQYWRTYYHFNGQHEVVPIFTPIYQDAVLANSFWETLREQYLQKRRWSWGVSDIPYVMEHTIGNKKIPFIDRWANALILWEGHITWSTTSIVLATSAWWPLILNPDFRETVLAFNFPVVYSRLLTVAWIGMLVSLIVSTLLVPPHRGRKPIRRIIVDWLLTPIVLPVSNILFSSIPALESQTRLMCGKKMEVFRVTVKSTQRSFVTGTITTND
ncbi:MAG: glycosyltransferase family 2 protein [Patescibacteria group bacterium]